MSCYPRRQPANMCWKQIWLLDMHGRFEDKSLNQMIETDKEIYDVKALALLSKFRDRLRDERNMYRVKGRNRQGRIQVKRDGSLALVHTLTNIVKNC